MGRPLTVERAYRMRVYPTRRQEIFLSRLFGAARFVWNWALARRTGAYQADKSRLDWVALSRELTLLRRDPETAWLAELPREPITQVLRDQERAFGNFFAQRARYPRFRRHGRKTSIRFTLDQRRNQVERGDATRRSAYLYLPGLGRVKARRTEVLAGRLRSVTLSRDGAGRYFASVTADRVPTEEPVSPPMAAVGVDAGLTDLMVIHDGERCWRVPAPKVLNAKLRRLRRYQRRQSRQIAAQMRAQGLNPAKPCPKGVRLGTSKRRASTRKRIARLHARVRDLRRDGLHRATTAIVRSADVIAIEALRVKALVRAMGRRGFRRAVADAALGEMRRQITYKGAWAGRKVVAVGTFFPSSKTCSACGVQNRELKLEKLWTCLACGARHDRDENAAKNIRAEGLRMLAVPSRSTAERAGSDARGVEYVADSARWATIEPGQPLHDEPRTGSKVRKDRGLTSATCSGARHG